MQAIIIREAGGPEVLEWGETADPVLGPTDLLVRVHASAVNRADMLQRMGKYPPPLGASSILGLEMAGEIVAIGAECVGSWQIGQRVMALLPGGGYAQQVAVSELLALPFPANLSFVEAAALPEAFLTAYLNLVVLGDLQPTQTVLIHAGGSGVGTAAIQLAREIGAKVLVTAGSDEKLARCRELGATGLINYKLGAFADNVKTLTSDKGVDLILDFVGADYFEGNLASLASNGKLLLIGQLSGSRVQLDLATVMMRRLHLTGTTLRARSLAEKADLTRRFAEFGLARFADGRFMPIVDRIFPMSEAAAAHRYMSSNSNFGKIVLSLD